MLEHSDACNQPTSCVVGSLRTSVDELPLDSSELRARCMGNEPLVERILMQVEPAIDENLAEINAALTAGDAPKIASSAHRLKGTAANVGAGPLRRAAWQLESLASHTADSASLWECYDSLVQERTRLVEAIHQIRSTLS